MWRSFLDWIRTPPSNQQDGPEGKGNCKPGFDLLEPTWEKERTNSCTPYLPIHTHCGRHTTQPLLSTIKVIKCDFKNPLKKRHIPNLYSKYILKGNKLNICSLRLGTGTASVIREENEIKGIYIYGRKTKLPFVLK